MAFCKQLGDRSCSFSQLVVVTEFKSILLGSAGFQYLLLCSTVMQVVISSAVNFGSVTSKGTRHQVALNPQAMNSCDMAK